ncbi:hypothetical protein ACFSO7_01880 [Bacillus sp. CGMCC 1.16607]
MSNEQQELFLKIITEAYQKGTTCRDISVAGLLSEMKEKLIRVIEKEA